MDKRYQVFISSTYSDLQEERRAVTQTIMQLDCITAGMELFPAADEEQMTFIKKVIDDCDYYLLIIGARYGSISESGISYTEQEYDYAVSRGLKVIAFLHGTPDEIAHDKTDKDPALREKLNKFRNKVATGRVVKLWNTGTELPGLVALSLSSTMKTFPAVGWVRANLAANVEVLNEVNELRKRNADLESALAETAPKPIVENLAGLDEFIQMSGTASSGPTNFRSWQVKITWRVMFARISPVLEKRHAASDSDVKRLLTELLFVMYRRGSNLSSDWEAKIDDTSFHTVSFQLRALGLVHIGYSDQEGWWSLTPAGERCMFETWTTRSAPAKDAPANPPRVGS